MTDAATASSRTMKGRNMVVVFFSRAGENYEVGEVTVGNTAKLAQEVARRTDSPMIEIARTEPYPERYAATSEMVQEEQRVNARPLFTLSGDVDALDSSDTVFLGYPIWCGDMPMPCTLFWKTATGPERPFIRSARTAAAGLDGLRNVSPQSPRRR